ncbi:MAG: hypothetical protein WBY94_18980 [Polyangiaceae bacterium]
MSRKSWKGLLASALIAALAVVIDGCSSSSNTTPVGGGDAAPDTGTGTAVHRDAGMVGQGTGTDGSSAAEASAGGATFDGTSGKPCSSNADCGSTGINVCSNTYSGKLNALNGITSPQFWPTPLCMVPLPTMAGVGNCDPGDPGNVQFCDSADPTDPTSPGICIPLTTPQAAGATNGFCLPHCYVGLDGTFGISCPGKDTCNALNFLLDTTTNMVQVHGFCQGTCQADADCSALGTGWVCQVDAGICTKAKKTRTKAIGTTCTNSGNGATPIATSDTETGACNCPFSGTATTTFYCTQTCVVGGTACPSGYACDALVPGVLTFTGADGGDENISGVNVPGLAGYCLAACSSPDGGVIDAGTGDAGSSGQCPGASTVPPLSACTQSTDPTGLGTAAGPDCLPPQ